MGFPGAEKVATSHDACVLCREMGMGRARRAAPLVLTIFTLYN